ncbi:MAG: 4-hydroxy-3-methylbut-2-enyl diphosphate reductase [Dehalococcoidaceae bacterium]|nr:4-hydroxy-3-methylbut-2-enyl diphosphate reductase [Dehalococcoidaceae bacterium]
MGFCQGVRRAVERVMGVAEHETGVETLGALVHNREVQSRLEHCGVRAVDSVEDITGETVVISAHGVSPTVIDAIKTRGINIINTTCPYVSRAQQAALKLYEAGFFVIVFGDANHVEVKGILGWVGGEGIATVNVAELIQAIGSPAKLGIVSQTTQIPSRFALFVADLINSDLFRDAEIRIVDTICHDSRRRQKETLEMAGQCDLVFVIGGRHSANTRHLKEMCAAVADTRLIETADEIDPCTLAGKNKVGVTAGASTDDETIQHVINRLRDLGGA